MSQSAGRAAVLIAFFPFVWLYRKLFRKHWQAIDDAYRIDNARERAAERARRPTRGDKGGDRPAAPGKSKRKGKGNKGSYKGKGRGKGKKRTAPIGATDEATDEKTDSPDSSPSEQALEPAPTGRSSYDWRPVCILIAVSIGLTLKYYYGNRATYLEYFPYDRTDDDWFLGLYMWTSGWRIACYALLPLLVIVLMPGERLRDYYLRFAGTARHFRFYALPLVAVALVMLVAGKDGTFYRFAVFERLIERSSLDVWVWIIALPLQYLAIEFLFRGFMLHGLRRSLGSKAIFVMMVPYCMIHHTRIFPPFSEILTAIIVAVLLGTLAMRTRSIWGPAILHMAGSMAVTLADIDHWILVAISVPLLWRFRGALRAQWQIIDDECRREVVEAAHKAAQRGAQNAGEPGAGASVPDSLAPGSYDWRPIVVLLVVAISLSLQEGYGQRGTYREYFPNDPDNEYWQLGAFMWWSGWRVFGYIVLPVIAILLMPGERLRDYYVSFMGFFKHLWIYGVLFLAILPAVIIAAQTESFYRTYPFYKLANRSSFDFWIWEALYVVQFLALEFFFRGFMLHGLRRSMGSIAIVVMCVSYCMIHYGKPFPETMGAIFAGIILGTLAMRTRSIWGGVLIHAGVAVSMDALAIQHCPSAESGLPCKGH